MGYVPFEMERAGLLAALERIRQLVGYADNTVTWTEVRDLVDKRCRGLPHWIDLVDTVVKEYDEDMAAARRGVGRPGP